MNTSYRLKKKETIPDGIRRIAAEQIDRAIIQLTESDASRDEAIHDARKCFKKTRAVVRLVRDEIGDGVYKHENVCFRDAGRALSQVRDNAVMIETLDSLADDLKKQVSSEIREKLVVLKRKTSKQILDDQDTATDVVKSIKEARKRLDDWPIRNDDFSVVRIGLKRVYKRGRKRLVQAYENPTTENFHEWRKRAKYLWYHTRILRLVWPKMMNELADSMHDLTDALGDDHDLAEFEKTATNLKLSNAVELGEISEVINNRRAQLQATAKPLGERIYAEKPSKFVNRIEAYWQTL